MLVLVKDWGEVGLRVVDCGLLHCRFASSATYSAANAPATSKLNKSAVLTPFFFVSNRRS